MKLILSRHGNTFNPGETAVWVGSRNDLPLVEAGIAQAKLLGQGLKQANIQPAAVYCGPLQRTSVYAQTVLTELSSTLSPIIDPRLNEIDYGHWTGLTNEQIRNQFGSTELEAWEKHSQWPASAGWQDQEQNIITQIKSFTEDVLKNHANDDTILVISSNGRLRYFLKLIPAAFNQYVAQQNFKIATGNICQLTHNRQHWHINFWNVKPPVGLNVD